MYVQDPYLHFQLHDFVWDETFRLDILHDQNSDQLFNKWVIKYPEKRLMLEQARLIILSLQTEEQLFTQDEVQSWINDTKRLIDVKVANSSSQYNPIHKLFNYKLISIAAILLLVLFATFFLVQRNTARSGIYGNTSYNQLIAQSPVTLQEETNQTNFPKIIMLPDGSRVTLSKKSKISFPNEFQSSSIRLIYLTGEAFFDVVKNPQKPFYVHTDGLAVRVLGTSFKVSSYDSDKEVVVEVQSGKVSVFSNSGLNISNPKNLDELSSMVLVPNQKVSYSKEDASFIKTLVNEPRLLHTEKEAVNRFYFMDEAVSNIFKVLQEAYGVEIVFDEELLKECTLNANLEGYSLYEQLNIISKALNGTYEVLDGRIVFSAKGCGER